MANISTYMKNKIQDYIFSGTTFTPTTYYLALSSTAPNADGTGVTEPSGMAYTRVAITRNSTSFTASASGTVKNAVRLNFAESTGAWGTLTHYAIYDAVTGGNMLWYAPLTKSRAIQDEMQMFIDINGLTFTLS